MPTKNVARYRLDARIQGEIEYDPSVPSSYGEALAKIDEKRQALIKADAKLTKDDVKPVGVKSDA